MFPLLLMESIVAAGVLMDYASYVKKDWGTTVHCLYLCKGTKETWKHSIYWDILKKNKSGTMLEIGKSLRACMSKDNYSIWAITSYFTWIYLCNIKHNNERCFQKTDIIQASSYLADFKAACKFTKHKNLFGELAGEKTWRPPQQDTYLLDVAATVDMEMNLFGIGVVIRDWNGNLIAALAKPIDKPNSVADAIFKAIIDGITLCKTENLGAVKVYSNSMNVIRNLKDRQKEENFLETNLLQVAKALQMGVILSFNHVYRCANIIAHSLAHFGARSDNLCTWNSFFPHWLRD
ncbi:hypothetical protein C2S51_030457 [Perilla frutescens var. frutescens]|nr:hypothetical protein C2S51_030457 [Perilla frutescens var. frutescens]